MGKVDKESDTCEGCMIIGEIEIASSEYWKRMSYYNGLLYCSLLVIEGKDDWRMVKDAEEMEYIRNNYIVDYVKELANSYMLSSIFNGQWGWVIPVRDL